MSRRYFLVAGERSGDAHGAALMREIRALDPEAEFSGYGGGEMSDESGGAIEDWEEEAGVVGLWEVLKKYGYFKSKLDEAIGRVRSESPAAVIFIDYPGFNLRMAKALASEGNGAKRVYFISPQVWAWNRGRIPKMAVMLDLMLCIFPFEKVLYEKSGLRTEFVGHPLVDQMRDSGEAPEREDGLVGLFPGSRVREVEKLFPAMVDGARILLKESQEVKFIASAASEKNRELMRQVLVEKGLGEEIEVEVGNSRKLMQRCWVGVVASGTATLEAAFCGMPYCLVYRVAPLTYCVGKVLVRVKYLGIVNILAGREVVRELIQGAVSGEGIAGELGRLIVAGGDRKLLEKGLAEVVRSLGDGGTAKNGAREIVGLLGGE